MLKDEEELIPHPLIFMEGIGAAPIPPGIIPVRGMPPGIPPPWWCPGEDRNWAYNDTSPLMAHPNTTSNTNRCRTGVIDSLLPLANFPL